MRLSFMETGFVYGNALRAQGLPYGAIAAAVRMVQWAEVHHGIGVAYLDRRARPRVPSRPPRVLAHEGGRLVVDAGGGSSLVVGPGVLDLACAAAAAHGVAAVAVRALDDLGWLGALAAQATRRGLACVLSFAADPASSDARDLAALYSPARSVFATPAEPAPWWIEAPLAHALHEGLLAGEALSDVRSALALASRPAAGAPPPGASLLCLTAAVGADDAARTLRGWPGERACAWEPDDLAALRRRAFEQGMAVDDAAFAAVTRRALATVIPSSEESRHQAGAEG